MSNILLMFLLSFVLGILKELIGFESLVMGFISFVIVFGKWEVK